MRLVVMGALMLGAPMLGLMGCGTREAKTPEQVACEARANDDPQVKLLIMKGAGSTRLQEDSQDQLKQARNASVRACLEQRGALRPGGVERQKPL